MSQKPDENLRFDAWSRDHGQAVRGYLMAMVRRVDVADDLMQEVFCRAWQARSGYREQGNARAYLLRIADRLVYDRARKAGREVTLDEENWQRIEPTSPEADPGESMAKAESNRQLTRALDSLSPVQRRILLLRYYGQLGFSEIAQIVDCPLNTALSHCRRGLLALRKTLVENVP